MKVSKAQKILMYTLLGILLLALLGLVIKGVLPWWSLVIGSIVFGTGGWSIYYFVSTISKPKRHRTTTNSSSSNNQTDTDSDGHQRVEERPHPTYYPLGIPPFIWTLIGIALFALLLIIYGIYTVKTEEWWIAVVAVLLGGGIITVVSRINKGKVMGAVLNALLFTGLCIGVWYTATQWKPWESWSSNLSNKHVTSETDGGKPTSSITVTVSEKPPGPELIWGTNELVAGKHYELSGSITMYPFLASPWKPNLVWHYEKQGEETSVYYDRIFREDGGSYIDPATDHRDGSPGNYYFIPSEDMTVRLQKSP